MDNLKLLSRVSDGLIGLLFGTHASETRAAAVGRIFIFEESVGFLARMVWMEARNDIKINKTWPIFETEAIINQNDDLNFFINAVKLYSYCLQSLFDPRDDVNIKASALGKCTVLADFDLSICFSYLIARR